MFRHLAMVTNSVMSLLLQRIRLIMYFNAAGEWRRQVKMLTSFVKNVNNLEFHDHIWNRNERCIQISTNMPSIGSLIREIAIEISEM